MLSASDKKNIFVTVNLLHKNPQGDMAVTGKER
jgi:hypothetical protein